MDTVHRLRVTEPHPGVFMASCSCQWIAEHSWNHPGIALDEAVNHGINELGDVDLYVDDRGHTVLAPASNPATAVQATEARIARAVVAEAA